MIPYIVRRLLLLIPTLWLIITINFFIIQVAPGGPVEQMLAQQQGISSQVLDRITNNNSEEIKTSTEESGGYNPSQGLDDKVVEEIRASFGFDKPIHIRYGNMLWDYAKFDFGDSLFKANSVIGLIIERLPVSISLGLWVTIITYMVAIPLGIKKAIKNNSTFDIWTSTSLIITSAIPSFILAILMIILFAGGEYVQWFPLRGITSLNWEELNWLEKIIDYFWHMALPIFVMVIGSFTGLALLTKNSFLDELGKQYVVTARAKGNSEKLVLYKHVFRNAMLIIIAGFPAAFISIFFAGSLLIEVIFSLEGLGLLGFESTMQRDYPVMFGTLYMFTILGLIMGIVSDIMYTVVDPRIDFEGR